MIRRFTKVGTKWQGVDFIDIDDSNGDCWFIFKGVSTKQQNGLYLISTCEKFVKEGGWKEVPLEEEGIIEIKPKGKRTYGEVKASDNHYHRILVRKGTKAIVKNSHTYYKSKYFVVDILTGIVEELCNTFKEAKEALKDES